MAAWPTALLTLLTLLTLLGGAASAQPSESPPRDTSRGDAMIVRYFQEETARLAQGPPEGINALAEVGTAEQFKKWKSTARGELREMLGLDPEPPRTDLQATITGTTETETMVIERLHFQSRPGLYVTANLYRPKEVSEPLPAILYVCGHGNVKEDGVSYGSKVRYQHHPAWFAQNGYVCLILDTLQLGEIEGIHHGTYRYDMWWWLNRGYSPAGVEAWNCVRALDYLQSRPEVDGERLGVTGRSGGGIYSWWIAALDDRVGCAVPVAGITDLENHVVDGCVEGHCDCMYMVNTYRWDYPQLAALIAPRPLLISNTDSDGIFPLDGVYRTFEQTRRIYRLLDAAPEVALNITAGGHRDTQELRTHAFRWFNQHLKDDDSLIVEYPHDPIAPEDLKVFDMLPEDQLNTEIHAHFVPQVETPEPPRDEAAWKSWRDETLASLRQRSFGGWPKTDEPLEIEEAFSATHQGITLRAVDFTSQGAIRLRLFVAHREDLEQPELAVLNLLDADGWDGFLATLRPAFEAELKEAAPLPPADEASFAALRQMLAGSPWAMAYAAPRGVGPTAWTDDARTQTHRRRRFYLLGQTLEGQQAYDARRAMQAVRSLELAGESGSEVPLWLQARGPMAATALYASLFESAPVRLDLYDLPHSHDDGPYLLNVDRIVRMPQTIGLAAERSRLVLYQDDADDLLQWARQTADHLSWPADRLQSRTAPGE